MYLKILGAALILLSCGGYGFSLANAHRAEERALNAAICAMEDMIRQLSFQLTPMPQLLRNAGKVAGGRVGAVFVALSKILEENSCADPYDAMQMVLSRQKLPPRTAKNLSQFGISLGRFSLSGQVSSLKGAIAYCKRDLDSLSLDRDSRLRSYRTLGLCTGAALVILFL